MRSYFDNSISCQVAVNTISGKDYGIKVVPNPGDENMELQCAQTIQKATLIVFDITGKQIVSLPLDNTSKIKIGKHLTGDGMYFYKIMDKDQNITGKLLFRSAH